MNQMKRHVTSGLWIREDPFFGDEGVIKEQLPQYGRLHFQHEIVMDVGSDFGAFANFALSRGASKVVCYEPFEESFSLLTKNHGEDPRVVRHNFAVTQEVGFVDFYLSNHYPSCHTTLPVRGRERISVPTLSFREELALFEPTLLKVDIEGGEYAILTEPLPSSIQQAAIEFHLRGHGAKEKILKVIEDVFLDWYLVNSIRFTWNVTTPIFSKGPPNGQAIKDLLPKWRGG